jgi:hypothetical protein
MSSSKTASKKRHGTQAASGRSKKPRAEEEEEVVEWDFSRWAWQDTEKAPLGGPAARWLGVQSLAGIVLRRDGSVCVYNATSKQRLKFEMGFVEGWRQKTHVVLPLDAPRTVADLFSNKVAKRVLESPAFLQRLCEAGGHEPSLRLRIDEVLAELNVYTPEEYESLASFFRICGGAEEDKLPLRAARVQGQLVMALIDAVMLAKKCTYEAAKKICQRLLSDYWHLDIEASTILEGTPTTPRELYSIQLQGGSHGGQATVCVTVAFLAEVLILIPGCELSTQLRRDMVRSFFGVGGSQVTFESLLANPRIQAHLRSCPENPLVEVLEDREHKELVRSFPDVLRQRDEALQLALQQRDEALQLALHQRDEALQLALQQRDEAQAARVAALEQSLVGVISSKFAGMVLSVASHINSSVTAAVAAGLGLKKAQSKKATRNSTALPEDQRATPRQTGPLSLPLSTVALAICPDLCFAVWRKIRSSFGRQAKKERQRRHELGERHPDYVAMPLLWAYTGSPGSVEGGGARYVYLQDQRALLQQVFQKQLPTSHAQRRAGAPCPTESLEQRAHRLTAGLSAAERALEWPIHTSELEPLWDEESED